MQADGGTLEDTCSLLMNMGYHTTVTSDFSDVRSVLQHLRKRVKVGKSEKFGLAYSFEQSAPNGISGHMVVLKVWKTLENLFRVRVVDFQLAPSCRFTKKRHKMNAPFTIIDLKPS